MKLNKTFSMILLVYCCVLSTGCQKTENSQESTTIVTTEYQKTTIREYEENGVKYKEESGQKQKIIYPVSSKTFADKELVGTYSSAGASSIQSVAKTDVSYLITEAFAWPVLYESDNVKSIEYCTYNARAEFDEKDKKPSTYNKEKTCKAGAVKTDGDKQDKLNMVIHMELSSTDDSWYMYRQSPASEGKVKCDILNSVLIEAKVIYKDGTEETDYYKIETQSAKGDKIDIYRLIE